MKKLVLGCFIALVATQAAGCIITTGDDTEDAYITADWTIRTYDSPAALPCPPGYDTAALYNQEVTASGAPIGSPIIDLFDCDAGSGVSAPLPPALYQSWIEITTHNNSGTYAQSLSAFVDVTVSDKSFSAQILEDGGYFQFAWQIGGGSCLDAPGGVDITSTVVNSTEAITDVYDCEDGSAISSGRPEATYTVSIAALDNNDLAVGVAPEITNAVISGPNQVTNLGTITIPLD